MTLTLAVPSKYHNAASIIADLSDEKMDSLITFLRDAPYPFSLSNSRRHDYTSLSGAKIQSPEEVIEFIASLFYLSQDLESSHPEDDMVEGIGQYFLREQPIASISTKPQVERLASNLRKIITSNSSLELTAKVGLIKSDRPHVYVQSKVYTDLRPIFGRSDTTVRGFVVTHALKLSYQDGEEKKDIFVSLDQSDLLSLRNAIERAEAKEISIREHALLSELPLFD